MLQKEQLGLCPEDFVLPVSFLLSMSLLGLEFPFAYILVFIVLYLSLIVNKYDFLLQSTISVSYTHLTLPTNSRV